MPSIAAFWPALLGVLAAHQIAYAGHDDGHVHGYLETVGPALVVAAVLGWIWSWARTRVDFRSVLRLQLALFVAMEGSERLAASGTVSISDLSPIGIALLLIPLVAALTVVTHRVFELSDLARCRPLVVGGGPHVGPRTRAGSQPGWIASWSIRAPPSLV